MVFSFGRNEKLLLFQLTVEKEFLVGDVAEVGVFGRLVTLERWARLARMERLGCLGKLAR